MLQIRNTPDPDCNISPAEIIFGRPVRDEFSFINRLEKYSNPHIRPLWRDAWAAKEEALRTRMSRTTESLSAHSRPLRPLLVGERVFIQNQRGTNPNKWDKSGTIVEVLEHDQYLVKVDGSGRLTLRNRRFLRVFTPVSESLVHSQRPYSTHLVPSQMNAQPQSSLSMTDNADYSVLSEGCDDTPRKQVHMNNTVPLHNEVESVRTPTSPRSSYMHPVRNRQPPKRYEPETGTWVN